MDIVPEVLTPNAIPELGDISEEAVLKVRLATLMTSPMFLNNPRVVGDAIRSVIASACGHDLETLSHDIQAILEQVIATDKHETKEETKKREGPERHTDNDSLTEKDINDAQNNDS